MPRAPPGKILNFGTLAPRPFRPPVGQKQVWLPNFAITMIRNEKFPPNFATFIVPLKMNKLDLKDYLWNAYGVPVVAARSYIKQQKVQLFKTDHERALVRRWHRPRSIKYMTAQLGTREQGRGGKGGGLFVWPNEVKVEDMGPWDRQIEAMANLNYQKEREQDTGRYRPEGGETLAEKARRLREGKEEWKPTWKTLKGQ